MIQEQKEIDDYIDDIEGINLQIYELQKTIAPKIEELTAKKREIEDVLNALIMREAMKQLSQNDYGCGTANIETLTHKIKAVVSKKTKWDEEKLRNIAEQIRSAGQDPETYITYKLSVSETAYKNFPPQIQKEFEVARSVEPSEPKITMERKY